LRAASRLFASHTSKQPLRPRHLRLLKQRSPTYDRSDYCRHEKREKGNQCTPRHPVGAFIRQPGSHPIMDCTDLRPTTRPPHQAPRWHALGWWTPAYDRRAHHRHKQKKTTRAKRGVGIVRGDDRRPPAAGHLTTAGGALMPDSGGRKQRGRRAGEVRSKGDVLEVEAGGARQVCRGGRRSQARNDGEKRR